MSTYPLPPEERSPHPDTHYALPRPRPWPLPPTLSFSLPLPPRLLSPITCDSGPDAAGNARPSSTMLTRVSWGATPLTGRDGDSCAWLDSGGGVGGPLPGRRWCNGGVGVGGPLCGAGAYNANVLSNLGPRD
jgi:hypothetical protein